MAITQLYMNDNGETKAIDKLYCNIEGESVLAWEKYDPNLLYYGQDNINRMYVRCAKEGVKLWSGLLIDDLDITNISKVWVSKKTNSAYSDTGCSIIIYPNGNYAESGVIAVKENDSVDSSITDIYLDISSYTGVCSLFVGLRNGNATSYPVYEYADNGTYYNFQVSRNSPAQLRDTNVYKVWLE